MAHHFGETPDAAEELGEFDQQSYVEVTAVLAAIVLVAQEISVAKEESVEDENHVID
jgi:hypothetical protein